MNQHIDNSLGAIEAELADQNRRLTEVTTQLEGLPDDLAIALDDAWKDDFERATDVRPAPTPVPRFPVLRV